MQKDNKDKTFHVISKVLICPDMKKTTLEKIAETMEFRKNVVVIPEEIRLRAKRALDRMLAIA